VDTGNKKIIRLLPYGDREVVTAEQAEGYQQWIDLGIASCFGKAEKHTKLHVDRLKRARTV
jgi:hypothetical protein